MKTLYSSLTILIILSASCGVHSTDVSACDNGEFPEVEVSNCKAQPCIFYIGESSSMTMRFKSPRYLENIAPKASAFTMGINITDYPLGQNDACEGITNTPCPLAPGEYTEYTYSMFILPIFPPTNLGLQFSLIDKEQNNEPFVCFKMDVQVMKKP